MSSGSAMGDEAEQEEQLEPRRPQELKDGMKPTPQQKLQLCLLNRRSIRSDFEHNSLLWLPIKIDFDGKGVNEWWYPVRVQWTKVLMEKSTRMRNIAGIFVGRHHPTKIAVYVPGGSKHLLFLVDSQSERVKETFAKAYEAGDSMKVPEWQKDMGGIGPLKDADAVKKNIIKINQNMLESAVEQLERLLPQQHEAICAKQKEHWACGLDEIRDNFKGDTSDIPIELSDSIADVSSALGHPAERVYTGPAYEELYLFVHSLLYFGLFAVLFCTTLAFSTYSLMQFFFMFLLRLTLVDDGKSQLSKDSIKLSAFSYFWYYYCIPYLLMGVSVVGYELLLLIRSTVRTPQMSRPRALMIGLFLIWGCKGDDLEEYRKKHKDKAQSLLNDWEAPKDPVPPLFWKVLKQAVAFVDSWFTVGIDGFMLMGCLISNGYTILMGYNSYRYTDSLLKAAVCLGVILLAFGWLRRQSNHYAYSKGKECVLEGRMLNWKKRWQFLAMFVVMWLGMFLCVTNPTATYSGVVSGGIGWAIATSILCMFSELCLKFKQRDLITMLEMCLDDRAVAPGRMEVRFYEIKNRMQQQLKMMDNDSNPFSFEDVHLPWKTLITPACLTVSMLCGHLKPEGKVDKDEIVSSSTGTMSRCHMLKSLWSYLKLLWNYPTLGYLACAQCTWILSFSLTEIYIFSVEMTTWSHAVWVSFSVVMLVFLILWFASHRFLALLVFIAFLVCCLVSCFNLLPSLLGEETAAQALQSGCPALLLIPVMVCWHEVLVRRMHSISHGSAKATIHRRLFNFNGYHALMIFYSFGSVLFFLAGAVISQATVSESAVDEMGMYVKGSGDFHSGYQEFTYPVCKMSWGPRELDLGVLDLAILSKYAYADNMTTFKHAIAKSFGADVQAVEDGFDNFTDIPRKVTTKFVSKKSDGGNVTTYVVAFKGTSTLAEAFADGSLYAGVAVLGFLSQFIGVFDLLPNTMISFYLNHLRLRPIKNIENHGFKTAADWIDELRTRDPGSHIVLTGHSLGGGFASAIGGITTRDAITFSAPGAHFNRFVFRNSFQTQWRNVVNVWPYSDAVPHVDRHDEMVQRIVCKNPKDGRQPTFVDCHLISSTICELWRVCGDPHGRRMTMCTNSKLNYTSYNYSRRSWGKYIVPDKGTSNRSNNSYESWDAAEAKHMGAVIALTLIFQLMQVLSNIASDPMA